MIFNFLSEKPFGGSEYFICELRAIWELLSTYVLISILSDPLEMTSLSHPNEMSSIGDSIEVTSMPDSKEMMSMATYIIGTVYSTGFESLYSDFPLNTNFKFHLRWFEENVRAGHLPNGFSLLISKKLCNCLCSKSKSQNLSTKPLVSHRDGTEPRSRNKKHGKIFHNFYSREQSN